MYLQNGWNVVKPITAASSQIHIDYHSFTQYRWKVKPLFEFHDKSRKALVESGIWGKVKCLNSPSLNNNVSPEALSWPDGKFFTLLFSYPFGRGAVFHRAVYALPTCSLRASLPNCERCAYPARMLHEGCAKSRLLVVSFRTPHSSAHSSVT